MSVQTEISCNNCKKQNFKGKRYKCLRCFDYDLCNSCYELNDQPKCKDEPHNSSHAMQCIIPKEEFELYYAGENISSQNILSFTCPLCAKTGLTEQALKEHVAEHTTKQNPLQLVVCPLCLAVHTDDTIMTDDLASHISLHHGEDNDEDDEEEEDDDDSDVSEDEQTVTIQQQSEPTRLNLSQLDQIRQRVLSMHRNVSELVVDLETRTIEDISTTLRADMVPAQGIIRRESIVDELPRDIMRGIAEIGIPSENPSVRRSPSLLATGNSRRDTVPHRRTGEVLNGISGIPLGTPPSIREFVRSLDIPTATVSPRTERNTHQRSTIDPHDAIDLDFELAAQLQQFEETRGRRGGGEIVLPTQRSTNNANRSGVGISHIRAAHELRMAAFARYREETQSRFYAYEPESPGNSSKIAKIPKIKPETDAANKGTTEPETKEPAPVFLLKELFKKMELDDNRPPEEDRTTFINELLISSLIERENSVAELMETIDSDNLNADTDEPKESDNQ